MYLLAKNTEDFKKSFDFQYIKFIEEIMIILSFLCKKL